MAFEKVEIDEKPKATTPKDGEQAKKETSEERKVKADTKPRKTTARKPGPKTLEAKLLETQHGLGTLLIMAGQVGDGVVIYARADALSHAWSQAAEQNKYVKQILTALTEGGIWGTVLITTTSVALPIMKNHGMFPGIPNPFPVTDADVDKLPDELQAMVKLYEQMMQEAANKAAANGGAVPGPTPAV